MTSFNLPNTNAFAPLTEEINSASELLAEVGLDDLISLLDDPPQGDRRLVTVATRGVDADGGEV